MYIVLLKLTIYKYVSIFLSFRDESNRNIYDCRTFLARFVEKHLSDFDEGMCTDNQ